MRALREYEAGLAIRRLPSIALLVVAVSHVARSQSVAGTVRDSASGQPLSGVVVQLKDISDSTLARSLSDEGGIYSLVVSGKPSKVQFLRLGFRPESRPLLKATGVAGLQLDIGMAALPSMLNAIQVEANPRCSARPDRESARSVWEQTRWAMLASIVARESNPATIRRIAFQRTMDAGGQQAVRQTVRSETATGTSPSFFALRAAPDLAQRGFRDDSAGYQRFYSPDAEILVADEFERAYCFHFARSDNKHGGQIGLAFEPAQRRAGRVDITGELWIDTLSRTLESVEFRYLGLDAISEGLGAGGMLSFTSLPNGVVMLDRWKMRLVGASAGSDDEATTRSGGLRTYHTMREIGGEVANATWGDGTSWSSPLGRARIRVVNERGLGVSGMAVGLVDTDYRSITDSLGYADISALAPGPYSVFVADTRLAEIGVTLPTGTSFSARRGSLVLTNLTLPNAENFATQACIERGYTDVRNVLIARVTQPRGVERSWDDPRNAMSWRAVRQRAGGDSIVATGKVADENGFVYLCDALAAGERVRVDISSRGKLVASGEKRISERLNVLHLPFDFGQLTDDGRTEADLRDLGAVAKIGGSVRDSVSGAAISGASVSLRDTPYLVLTDSNGTFAFPALNRRDYVLEVRTSRLDSIGTLKRIQLPLNRNNSDLLLFLPTERQIATAMCGASGSTSNSAAALQDRITANVGVLVGRIDPVLLSSSDTMLVVAEWRSSGELASAAGLPATMQRMVAAPSPNGSYQMCDVPIGVKLSVSLLGNGNPFPSVAPVEVTLTSLNFVRRADLTIVKPM